METLKFTLVADEHCCVERSYNREMFQTLQESAYEKIHDIGGNQIPR